MKVKTADLSGPALDWAVAKCGAKGEIHPSWFIGASYRLAYSTDWARGGPIIEREGITLRCGLNGWDAELPESDVLMHGSSALIAAMRVYVASKLGDEVDVPEELS